MKAKTYTQLHVQLVFTVKNRDALLTDKIRDRVFNYMGGILSDMNHKPLMINGTANHVHIFIGFNPAKSISETVHSVKRNTSQFINRQKLCAKRFSWQEGYGAFSYSKSHVEGVCRYIENQENHHKHHSITP